MKLSQPSSPEVAVAGHICLDLIPALLGETAVIPGKLLAVGPAVTSTGGAVSNTGLALHRLGFHTRLLGKVGDDLFGKSILAIVGQYGKELADGMIVSAGEHSSYTVVVSPPGADRCFWHYSGTNDTFGEDDLAPESLQGLRLFHLGYPTLMKRLYRNEGRELEQLLRRVKEQGITVSLDLAEPDPSSEAARQDWRAILARALPYTDIFLPSFEELLFLLRREQFMEMKRQYGHDLLPHVETELLRELTAELLGGGAAVAGVKLGTGGFIFVRRRRLPGCHRHGWGLRLPPIPPVGGKRASRSMLSGAGEGNDGSGRLYDRRLSGRDAERAFPGGCLAPGRSRRSL
ncbi:carbohydrate kinase family protein [Paenibacillus sp. CC-CFT747]|nr:carbohydrate kinase family protein [Paenibacillus sp. CC-CFT747]